MQSQQQNIQSTHWKTWPEDEIGESKLSLKTFNNLKEETGLGGKISINARELWRVRRELNPRPSD